MGRTPVVNGPVSTLVSRPPAVSLPAGSVGAASAVLSKSPETFNELISIVFRVTIQSAEATLRATAGPHTLRRREGFPTARTEILVPALGKVPLLVTVRFPHAGGGSYGDLRSCNYQLAICSRDFAMEDTTTHSHRSCSGSREPVDDRRTTVWTTGWITVWITRCTTTRELVLARDSGSSASRAIYRLSAKAASLCGWQRTWRLSTCRARWTCAGAGYRRGCLRRTIQGPVGARSRPAALRHPSRTAPNTACGAKATPAGLLETGRRLTPQPGCDWFGRGGPKRAHTGRTSRLPALRVPTTD